MKFPNSLLWVGLLFVGHAEAARVPVPEDWKRCSKPESCVEVETSCNSCCAVDALEKRYAQRYARKHAAECRGKEGPPLCDCLPSPGVPACVDGRCRHVPASGAGS